MKLNKLFPLIALPVVAASTCLNADIIITAVESGPDVIISYTGSFSVDNLDDNMSGDAFDSAYVTPSTGDIYFGGMGVMPTYFDCELTYGTAAFGAGLNSAATSSSGDIFCLHASDPSGPEIIVDMYGGGDISGSLTFEATTFAALGIDYASFSAIYTLGNGERIIVGTVPEPSTYASLAGLVALLGAGAMRRRNAKVRK